ncbi:hypothetical protein [Empedobacter brevis]|uniref:tetratricopeptide repeat protein n=1 Tax=Empedobacter brevis TaxID=247 RepID=UPI0039AF9C99
MTRIEYLVAHPYEVERSDIPLLKKEVEKYPYFYTLRALLLYGLKKENHPSFEDYLNKTSIHSSNRVDLYHYINSKPIQKEIQTETISESNLENSTSEIIEDNNETVEVIDKAIEEELNQEIETISESNSEEINENIIVDEMIENDTEESELKTDDEVDLISDEELNEVAEITNKFVEENNSSKEEMLTSENDIKNAVQQTSGIEITESEPQQIIETIEDNQKEEQTNKLTENIEIIENSKPEVIEEKVEFIENNSDNSTFSFTDWLKKVPSQSKTQKEIEEEQEIAEREIKYKLIDDFLEKNPKIVPMKKTDITPVSSSSNFVQNTEEYSDLMTETLAQIYIEQKKYDKAIKAYKILILKYPEKNSLFANRIKEIENLKNSK